MNMLEGFVIVIIVALFFLFILRLHRQNQKSSESSVGECGDSFCHGRSDPRCISGNCTYHCQSIVGCNGACISAWLNDGAARDIAKNILEKAK